MRILYAGTPEFAVPALEALIQSDHQVVAVYTQPDRPSGRGRKLSFSAVKDVALQNGLPVIQPQSFKSTDDLDELKSFNADVMVVAAYGIILPQAVLDAPKLGCINIHASLLPRWRGAAPIQRAILAGDSHTGVTLMQMEAGLDSGDMLVTERIKIDAHASAADLHDTLKVVGAGLLMDQIDAIEKGTIVPQKQDDSLACYAEKLNKQEAEIDWSKSAEELSREIRAFNPWPVSFTSLSGSYVKIWSAFAEPESVAGPGQSGLPGQVVSHDREGIRVSCGDGLLNITELQFAGKKRSRAEQLLNSRPLTDETFGC